jgi:3-dehydroquinate synthase
VAARELSLRHPRGETRMWLGEGALAAAASTLGDWVEGRRLFVVTDPRVRALHGVSIAGLAARAGEACWLEVPEGEAAKSVAEAERLWRRMLEAGGKRDSRLLALGGGSVGDLGGFVAGCFLRGVEHALLPTTLLAQLDAAIGGKTAIDLPGGKNSVGLFRHPAFVVGEATWLGTLPRPERAAGLFEAIKAGFVLDTALFERIESDLDALLEGDAQALGQVVGAAAAAKVRIVEEDPEEAGSRQLLNFGHTLAHALESLGGYRGLRHGEAVGYGMLFATWLGEEHGLPAEEAGRLRELVRRVGLPETLLPSTQEILETMRRDKKAREDGLRWVVPECLGRGRVEVLPVDTVRRALEAWRRSLGRGDPSPRV